MKTQFLFTICTFLTAFSLFAQSPEWTTHQKGIKKNYFRDSSWIYTEKNHPFEYGEFPFIVKEEHSQTSVSHIYSSFIAKNGGYLDWY